MTRVPHRILVGLTLLVTAYAGVLLGVGTLGARALVGGLGADVLLAICGMTVFTVVGALIEDRRPGNAVGRICLAVGLTLVGSTVLRVAVGWLDAQPGVLPPVGAVLALGSSFSFGAGVMLGQLLVMSRFPDGRVPGWLGRATDVVIVSGIVLAALNHLRPGRIEFASISPTPNPLALDLLSGPVLQVLDAAGFSIYGIGLLAGLATLVLRYRRGSSIQRAQIRWFLAAIAISGLLLVGVLTVGDTVEVLWSAWLLSTLLAPIAVGIAVLRYRLYEIDRIISRTIGYGLVTAVLAAIVLATNLLLQTWLAKVTGANTVGVALSTLLVATLFQPLRRIIQAPVDRRFNRARIDGARTLAAFGDRVRAEVDLANLSGAVLATADEAVRPSITGLWLRGGAR